MSDFTHYEYTFQNPALLQNALTHSSYANENRDKGVRNNERREFLGDSVLGLICAKHIYSEYRSLPEGELTKLRAAIVCEGSLYEFAMQIDLGERLLLGRGERVGGGSKRPSVLADAVEAGSCKVVSDVYSSSKPISPNILKTTAMAAVLAFLAVCALVVLQELFHDYIVDDADMERKLGITALGVIPDVEV